MNKYSLAYKRESYKYQIRIVIKNVEKNIMAMVTLRGGLFCKIDKGSVQDEFSCTISAAGA